MIIFLWQNCGDINGVNPLSSDLMTRSVVVFFRFDELEPFLHVLSKQT